MEKILETLYSRNSNGSINQWYIQITQNADLTATMVFSEGIVRGNETVESKHFTKGKNIGKSNATTPFEQACSEAESRWKKKKQKGYKSFSDLKILEIHELDAALPMENTDANGLSKPMKAQPYYKIITENKVKIKTNIPVIKFPCFGQPKLNGFRVTSRLEKMIEGEGLFATEVIKPTFRSKEGLQYTILEHIENEIEPLINQLAYMLKVPPKDVVLDGEMYIPNTLLSDISSAVKTRQDSTLLLKYHIFDLAVPNVSQDKRLLYLEELAGLGLNTNTVIVPYCEIPSNEIAQTMTDSWIKQGYEGGIFRHKTAMYQFGKRPLTMTKLKRSMDKEYTIVDVVSGENSPDLGVFVCITPDNQYFKVNPEGNTATKMEYLTNRGAYIGKKLTVKFYEYTKDGLPFHAVGTAIRDYE